MVSKDEIIKIAKKEKLPLGTVEKDFILSYILKKIYDSDLKDKLVFKGGTALHKLYLHKRISIDLDFTEIKPVKIGELKEVIESLKEKKLTVREAAQLLNIEYWEMQQIMDEEGVHLIDISEEEVMKRQNNKF